LQKKQAEAKVNNKVSTPLPVSAANKYLYLLSLEKE